jgi:hypothetical protein
MQRHTKATWISVGAAAQRVVARFVEFLNSDEGRAFGDGGAGRATRKLPLAAAQVLEDQTRATSPASRKEAGGARRWNNAVKEAPPAMPRPHRQGKRCDGVTPAVRWGPDVLPGDKKP